MKNVVARWRSGTRRVRRRRQPAGRSCRQCAGRLRPSRPHWRSGFSWSVTRYPPSALQRGHERVVDRRIDEQVAVRRAAGAVVVGLADGAVARRLVDVGGLVDHHRRVAGADAVRRLSGCVGGLDHRRAAGGNREIADRHQLVRERNARAFDALQQIFRRPQRPQRRAHQPHGLRSVVLRLVGMRREDDRVLALDRVDGDADRRDVGARDGNQRRDDAHRLRVLHAALAPGSPRSRPCSSAAARREECRALSNGGRLAAAHPGFVDAHVREPRGGGLVRAAQRSPGTADRRWPDRTASAAAIAVRARVERSRRRILFFRGHRSLCAISPHRGALLDLERPRRHAVVFDGNPDPHRLLARMLFSDSAVESRHPCRR